jgi:pyruvate formate-lyase activating enzyme-like uncharacterized protein
MKKIKELPDSSAYFGLLPEGCKSCGPGKKMVLLITGKCPRKCFYCPLSAAKRGKKVIYANELKVNDLSEIVSEAEAISAEGTGITGGDPMLVPAATLSAIRLLKSTFGEGHHIHLYTTGLFDLDYIPKLVDVGLDELRFHPPLTTWDRVNEKFERILEHSLSTELSVGCELPVLPGYEDQIIIFAKYLDRKGVEFLNLNELELSETNLENCEARGYIEKSSVSNAVLGSEELAHNILSNLAEIDGFNLNVHYCSAQFKDRQQLRNRLRRRAKNVLRPFELLTEDDTLLLGVVEPVSGSMKELESLRTILINKYEVPSNLIHLDNSLTGPRLEVAPWILTELKEELENLKDFNHPLDWCFIIEEYPTADRLEVERIPLVEFKVD